MVSVTRHHAVWTAITDVFKHLLVAFETVFEDLDSGLKLAGLIIAGSGRLFEQVIFFPDLCQ